MQLPIEFLAGKSMMLDGPKEVETINKFFENLPQNYFSINWCSRFIFGYYTLNREDFLKGKKVGDQIKKLTVFHLKKSYLGKIVSIEDVITRDKVNMGRVYHLKSSTHHNSFYLPDESFLAFGDRLVLYFSKTR